MMPSLLADLFAHYDLSTSSSHLSSYGICLFPILVYLGHKIRSRQLKASQPRGCRRIGLRAQSNLNDEEDDEKYAKAADQDKWKVKALMIYPIKSCAPVELDAAEVESTGLKYDRQFCFAIKRHDQVGHEDPKDKSKSHWEFRTLRNPGYERMVLVRTEIWVPDPTLPTSQHPEYRSNMESRGVLVVHYPRVGKSFSTFLAIRLGLMSPYKSFRVPLFPPASYSYPSENVTIWKDKPKWLNFGKHLPTDFKDFLGVQNPFTLFRVDPASYREVFRCAPRKDAIGYQPVVGFADAYPVHLLPLASVRNIAARVKDEIPRFSAKRFRPNFFVAGPSKFDEDNWKRVRIGAMEYFCACHAVRCLLPNVDPATGERHPTEPNATLKSFRCIDAGDPKNACLGLQLVPAIPEGIIRVGDKVEVLERGELIYIKQ